MTSRYILTLLLVLLLCSCNRRPAPLHPALQRAEQLMQKHPDSALAVLNNLNRDSFADRYQKEAYQVLFVQANDRCYQPITPYKKNMVNAISFFDSIGGNPSIQAKAHYYLGRIQQESHDDVETTKEFIAALNYAEEDKDSLLLCKIKSNLGFILWNNNLYDDAELMYKETIRLEENLNYTEGLVVSYFKLGDIAMQKKEDSKAEYYLKKALAKSSHIDNSYLQNGILLSLSVLYCNTKHYDNALKSAKKSQVSFLDSFQYYYSCLTQGKVFWETRNIDSAISYTKKSLISSDLNIKKQSCDLLISITRWLNDKDRQIYYQDKYKEYDKILQKHNRSVEITKQIQEEIKEQLKKRYLASNRNHIRYSLLLFFFLSVIFTIYIIYQKKQKKLALCVLQNDKANLKQKEILLNIKLQQILLNNQPPPYKEYFSHSQIYLSIMSLRQKENEIEGGVNRRHLNDKEWNCVISEIEKILQEPFVSRVKQEYISLSNADIRFCCLLKIGLDAQELVDFLGYSFQAINKRKKIIRERMNLTTFDDVLEALSKI